MKSFNWLGFVAVGLSASCLSARAESPNVLLVLTDDQGWGDFGFNGNDIISTPVLDALSQRSAHFTNFYVSPLSASTRAGILTGRDHLRTGAMSVTRSSENMDTREQTIAEVFKANNYATGCFGKWHNGAHYPQDPNGQGFDEFVGFCSGHLTNYFDSRLQHNQAFFNASAYITDVLTNSAIDFMTSSIEAEKPFFCYVPYNAPHAPYQVPDEYYEKYAHLEGEHSGETIATYAMCENLDFNIGRLLQYISDNDLDDNTIIIFLSDNGPHGERYNGGMRGVKGHPYEGGFKVPCLVYWQGQIEAIKLPQTASYVDLMPTILDLCGIEFSEVDSRKISGTSLKGLLTGEQDQLADRYLFTHRSNSDRVLAPNNGVIYNDTHKLITFEGGKRELYNKVTDPAEQHELSAEQPELAAKMANEYDEWFASATREYERSISRTAHIGVLDTTIELPAHEALMSGRTRYYTNIHGWAGDWMVDMAPEDSIYWEVIVDTAGDYQVTLQYSSVGRPHKVSLNGAEAVALESYAAQRIESPDRSPRVEAYEQIWGRQNIGVLHLDKGENLIRLLFNDNKKIEQGSLEVKGIEVTKLKMPIDSKASEMTVALYNNLHRVSERGVLFGQQDATTMGHIWSSDTNDRSDIKEMCGSHPAMIGADFSGLCSDNPAKVERSKEALVNQIKGTYARGGITTICWHMANPMVENGSFYWKNANIKAVDEMLPGGKANAKYVGWLENVADVMHQSTSKDRELIPIIIRPFHEFDGDWFWWGASHCSTEDFVALWRYTIDYLRDELGVRNALYAFSPDCKFESEEELLARYPGDDYVDVIAFDEYWDFRPDGANDPSLALKKSRIISAVAAKRGKIAAMSETGLEGVTDPTWYSQTLLPILKADGVNFAYVMVWRNSNYSNAHHYAPFKGHAAEADFVKFYEDEFTIFEDGMVDIYNLR
ncbi:MAG: sulfatase-like hydrolase/transferase [Rikenellaceae bacterium]